MKTFLFTLCILGVTGFTNALISHDAVAFEKLRASKPFVSKIDHDFEDFMFAVKGSCKHPESIVFHSASVFHKTKIGTDEQGRALKVAMHMQLFEDQTYWVSYSEEILVRDDELGRWYETVFGPVSVEGTFEVLDSRIQLDGLGSGVLQKSRSGKSGSSMAFTLETILNDSRAVDSAHRVFPISTNIGPRGIGVNDFCEDQLD